MSDKGWAKLSPDGGDCGDGESPNSNDAESQKPAANEALVDSLEQFANAAEAIRRPKIEEEDYDNLTTSPLEVDDQNASVNIKQEEDTDSDKKLPARVKQEPMREESESEDDEKPAALPLGHASIQAALDIDGSDEDRKPPSRLHMHHPMNDAINAELFDHESPNVKRSRHAQDSLARTPSQGSLAHVPEHAFDTTYSFVQMSPSGQSYQGAHSSHHHAIQNSYGYYDSSYPSQYTVPSHYHYSTHPYYQQHSQSYMMQQATAHLPYASGAAVHPANHDPGQHHDSGQHVDHPQHPGYAQHASEQEATTTSSGEHSAQFNRGPSLEELENAKTARARGALQTWYQRLEDLYRYRMENGHCNVPQKYPANEKLGIWVNKQRMEKKAFDDRLKTSMTERKIVALNALGFQWAKRKGDTSWNEKFEELKHYRHEHGNCEVPTKYPANPALGRWVSTQRSNYKEYVATEANERHKCRMNSKKIALLESLGFKWKMMNNGN